MPDHFPIVQLPIFVRPETLESALPLERTIIKAQITGPVASVVVTQHFGNPLKELAELDYLFPLPEEAAITGFEMQVGSRHILGDMQERDVARSVYEEARSKGKRTGLFEQRRPNLLAMRLANIQPGEKIKTSVSYQQRVKFVDGQYEFIYPMGLTPKYDRPHNRQEGEGVHAPIAKAGEKIGPVEIQVVIDAGIPTGDPSSPSHQLDVVRQDENRFQVRLPGEEIPDHDFVLRYPLISTSVTAAGWVSGEVGKEFFLVTMVPPRMDKEPQVAPREFIFVLDRSGSMTGEPIAQARNALRACLRSLNAEDTFRILLFDNELEWFKNQPVPVTQAHIDQADTYLNQVQGRGGTEIIRALEAVLTLREDPQRTRFIVFLTDGAVSAEAQALEQLRRQIGSARLFTFGIGPSVNRALLSRMARLGKGRAGFLQLDEDIEGAIIQFQDSVSFPVLTGLSLNWDNAKAWDVFPARLPDLYYGETLDISGRLARSNRQPARLMLHGDQGGQAVDLIIDLVPPTGRDLAMERVWAQAMVEDLLEQQELEPAREQKIRADILGLALDVGLVTPYTSFVAVDQEAQEGGGKPRIIHVAQPLPKGLHLEGFIPRGNMNMMGMVQSAGFLAQPAPLDMARTQVSGRPLRALMSKMPGRMVKDSAQTPAQEGESPGGLRKEESSLRWLARTQKLDGSWGGDVERSAAALLAFVRAGYTTRTGPFRQALRKVVNWLTNHSGTGFSTFVRALAFEELSRATGNDGDASLAQAVREVLVPPVSLLERAALGEPVASPAEIRSIDDLRLAAVLRAHCLIPQNLYKGVDADLVSTWSAALAQE